MGTTIESNTSKPFASKSWADIMEEEEERERLIASGIKVEDDLFELMDKNSRDGFNLAFKSAFSLKEKTSNDGGVKRISTSSPFEESNRPLKVQKTLTPIKSYKDALAPTNNQPVESAPKIEEISESSPITNEESECKEEDDRSEGKSEDSEDNKADRLLSSEDESTGTEEDKLKADKRGRSLERETNEHRLAQREKQIQIGKNTEAYKRYCEQTANLPKTSKRRLRTPDKYQICSKRSWDGQVIKWRRLLHQYDPENSTKATTEAPTQSEKEVSADKAASEN